MQMLLLKVKKADVNSAGDICALILMDVTDEQATTCFHSSEPQQVKIIMLNVLSVQEGLH